MNIRILYYTGTGNTAHLARVVSGTLEKAGHVTERYQVRAGLKNPASQADLLVVLFPVYALTVPGQMRDFLRKLPAGKGMNAAVLVNHGMVNLRGGLNTGTEGFAGHEAAGILKHRGYNPFIVQAVGYPENLTVVANPPSASDCTAITAAADSYAIRLCAEIVSGRPQEKVVKAPVRLISLLLGFLFTRIGKLHMGKVYTAGNSCNACGLCVRVCPARAISLSEGKPRWNYQCDACLGCYNLCPQKTIQVSVARLLLLLAVTVIPVVMIALAGPARTGLPWYLLFPLMIGVYGVLYTGLLVLGDLLLARLEKVPLLRAFLAKSYTSRLERYRAPDFRPE